MPTGTVRRLGGAMYSRYQPLFFKKDYLLSIESSYRVHQRRW